MLSYDKKIALILSISDLLLCLGNLVYNIRAADKSADGYACWDYLNSGTNNLINV